MKYWVFFTKKQTDGAYLGSVPEDGPDAYMYDKGIPLLEGYPKQEDAVMCMSSQYPDETELMDAQACMDTVLVVNTKIKDLLDAAGVTDVEYLPITIWDHQQKPASTDHMIMNPLNVIDFIDMEKSEYSTNAFFPERIASVEELVIAYENIPEGNDKIFRAKTKMDSIFINDDIYQILKNSGIKGVKFMEAEGWEGFDF